MSKVVRFPTWDAFRRDLRKNIALDRSRRDQILFRGQSSAKWHLISTLDRARSFSGDAERGAYLRNLLIEFQREATTLDEATGISPESEAFELLARHHGLPSPLLDWTESPYIAAYFAFEPATHPASGQVAIWMFDKALFDPGVVSINLIEDQALLRYNKRALRQRSRFMRVLTIQRPIERLLAKALTKIEIPVDSQRVALADLDEMAINATTLFPDLDGAARTAAWRVR